MDYDKELEKAIELAREAGKAIMQIYAGEITQELKADNSPLTKADLASHKIITEGLSKAFSYDILSEESGDEFVQGHKNKIWIVDPLDGTKDFIQKTDEFSVMIALLDNHEPVLGLVYAPALEKLYYAVKDQGAYLLEKDKGLTKLGVSGRKDPEECRMVISRNHFKEEDKALAQKIGINQFTSMGSVGIKYGAIAEGKAELCIYSTSKMGLWDDCAAHVILKEAGGDVFDKRGLEPEYDLSSKKMKHGFIGTNGHHKNEILEYFNPVKMTGKSEKGFVLWFTGLSGAGKSTVSSKVYQILKQRGIQIEKLDGDEVRENLTKGLGFNKSDREENIKRITFVTKLLSRNNVAVISAFITPYKAMRDFIRMSTTNFIEVFVNAPLQVCEERDTKGLYKKARCGEIQKFTGISDPYEPPEDPDLELRTDKESVDESVEKVIA